LRTDFETIAAAEFEPASRAAIWVALSPGVSAICKMPGSAGDQGDLPQGYNKGAPHRLRIEGDWIKTPSQTISQSPNHVHRVHENEENQL
jgi:hypothetical protein